MDYARFRDTAKRLIPKYGTVGSIKSIKQTVDPAQPWKSVATETITPIKLLSFPDDNVTFINHNITGDPRILLVAPSDELTAVYIGDIVSYGTQVATVKDFKKIDPDESGAILWVLLTV